ncbi:MAG: glycosyl hydrolase family 28-related protein, partial [Candidatus Cryptobacteroides sp.]
MQDTLVAGFETPDLDGFTAGERLTLSADDASALHIRPHQGNSVLYIAPQTGIPAREWKTVTRIYDAPEDFSDRPVAQFMIFTQQGPDRDQYVRMRLYGRGTFAEGTAKIIPGLWRNVMFDFTGLKPVDRVEKIEISLMCDAEGNWDNGRDYVIDGLRFGKPMDLAFMISGSEEVFSQSSGKVDWKNDALVYKFRKGSPLVSCDLTGSRNRTLSPPLGNSVANFYAQRNTFFVVMSNRSSASRVRLDWTTDKAQGSKEFEIEPRSGMKAYYFNISDCPEATGNLKSFSITPLDSRRGKWIIDQIRFEREEPIIEYAGKVESCTADNQNVRICGSINEDDLPAYSSICIYEYPLAKEGAPVQSLELLCKCPVAASFEIADLPNARLGGRMTHLSSRFLAVLQDADGNTKPVDKPFYISNWRDFCENPYHFVLPDKDFNVLRYGAKGDGFTDDTKAIQKAIDACNSSGGGRVVLPGDDTPQGRRYVATNIHLKSNVELHIEGNAILWQSYDMRDYEYVPAFGHDFDIPNCPWTHCLFVNLPLIQANNADHIKVTGPGKIRMADP